MVADGDLLGPKGRSCNWHGWSHKEIHVTEGPLKRRDGTLSCPVSSYELKSGNLITRCQSASDEWPVGFGCICEAAIVYRDRLGSGDDVRGVKSLRQDWQVDLDYLNGCLLE